MKRLAAVFLPISLIAAMLFSACATLTTQPASPAQTVYALHGDYVNALTLAVAYKRLPACATQPMITFPICSMPAVVGALQTADDVAFAALSTAQTLARSPDNLASVPGALSAAQTAIQAFLSLAQQYKVPQ